MTSKSEFCSQVVCDNLLNRGHDSKGTKKSSCWQSYVAHVFRWINHFCCHQFSRFLIFPEGPKDGRKTNSQQVGASMIQPVRELHPTMWKEKGITAHQISTCSCGRSPSLHDRRKGNRSTSWQRIGGSVASCPQGRIGAEKCSSSRNTDLKQVQKDTQYVYLYIFGCKDWHNAIKCPLNTIKYHEMPFRHVKLVACIYDMSQLFAESNPSKSRREAVPPT